MPASTILVLEFSSDRGDASLAPHPDLGRLHRHPDDRSGRGVREDRRAPARDHRPRCDSGPTEDGRSGRRRSAARSGPRPAMAAVPILCVAAHRRRRGADRVPRGRRRRRHRPAVRRARGRGPGRGAAAALPAIQGHGAGHLGRRPHAWPGRAASSPCTARRAASGRRPSRRTSRWRRRSGGRTGWSSSTSTSSSAASRPTSTWRAKQTLADVDPRRGGAARAGAAAHLRDPPRQRPARARRADDPRGGGARSRPTTSRTLIGTLLEGYDVGRHRCRLRARRAGADGLRGGRDHRPAGLPGDRRRSRPCTACSTT